MIFSKIHVRIIQAGELNLYRIYIKTHLFVYTIVTMQRQICEIVCNTFYIILTVSYQ